MTIEENLGTEWYKKLSREFKEPYMIKLGTWLYKRRKTHVVYPSNDDMFRVFRLTPYSKVKVVILGQDPYYNGLANGLAFGSNEPLTQPRSQEIIFDEIERDEKFGLFLEGDYSLEKWALQGVFLLNTILTVEHNKPKEHHGIGWERFIKRVIQKLDAHPERLVFMLWGQQAKLFKPLINDKIHLVLTAGHPASELYDSGRGTFKGCKHFSQANHFLEINNKKRINW